MELINATLALMTGLFLRLAVPIAITILVISLLRRLDARWQAEAEQMTPEALAAQIKCWQMKNCPPEVRDACVASRSSQPCWQERRLTNGYLREECLSCEVFGQAALPVHS